jgi:FKBP-type peptidyl-prolyl cis-trans isomerase 2
VKKGHFKGRVVEVSGTRVTIDTNPETRKLKIYKAGKLVEEIATQSWEKPNKYPPIGSIVRCIWRDRE